MKLLFATAAAVAVSIVGLTTAQAYPGCTANPSLTAGVDAGTLQAIDVSSATKKKKSMRRAGRAGASKAGTGGGAGGESGSGSAARGAQGRSPTR
jgi:hypothetical protein